MNIARQIKPVEPGKAVGAMASIAPLPALIRKAADQLASATTAAEILDAREAASVVYDAAKKAARMAKAKDAHDTLIAAAHRAQADALEIEAMAKRRLADEYRPIVAKLHGTSHYVPALQQHMPVKFLIAHPAHLDEARKYKRRKGDETIAEAEVLDELYAAVIDARAQ